MESPGWESTLGQLPAYRISTALWLSVQYIPLQLPRSMVSVLGPPVTFLMVGECGTRNLTPRFPLPPGKGTCGSPFTLSYRTDMREYEKGSRRNEIRNVTQGPSVVDPGEGK